jgi:hypothetical protein
MGIGYVFGCLFSILLWKLDRLKIASITNKLMIRFIKNSLFRQLFYLLIVIIIIIALKWTSNSEIYNFITAFLVIDISNTERKNLKFKDKTHFYDSISLISRSLLGGFIAPLIFAIVLGNNYAIGYMIIYNLSYVEYYRIVRWVFNILSIIPALIVQLFLYIIYIIRNRRYTIDFKGDYLVNCIRRPLLNLDILGAYIESVNFYYYFNEKNMHYIKSYGEYTNKIDDMCIKDYLSLSYGICLFVFIIFFILLRVL